MSCNRNGRTEVVSLTPYLGGTAANANYLLSLNFHTCGNKKLCTHEIFPVTADIKFRVMGQPVFVGNNINGEANYCCDVLITGTVTYMPYIVGGCQCGVCPRTDNIYTTICMPCSSAAIPTLTAGNAVAVPTGAQPCDSITNEIAITTSVNISTAEG